MSAIREPTEDEMIDFMSWLIDHKSESEQIDMEKIAVMDEPLEFFSEDSLGPVDGAEFESDFADTGGQPNCRWWDGRLYVVDLGDVRMVYSLL